VLPGGPGGASPRWLSSADVSRNTVLWTLVVFFGASLMFGYIRNATEDASTGTTLAAQIVAGLLLVAVIILYLQRRR
jgi:hypothetical protein